MVASFSRRIQTILRFFDLFSYSSFIRYKGESEFKTATGGFFSVAVLIIFAVLFTNLGFKTFQRVIISSSFNVNNSLTCFNCGPFGPPKFYACYCNVEDKFEWSNKEMVRYFNDPNISNFRSTVQFFKRNRVIALHPITFLHNLIDEKCFCTKPLKCLLALPQNWEFFLDTRKILKQVYELHKSSGKKV